MLTVVTGVSVGTATITVMSQDGSYAKTCAVTVISSPVDITMRWDAGSYANEAGWQLIDLSNNSVVYCVLTGPYTQSNTESANDILITLSLTSGKTYQVRGFDDWGDGWNGGGLFSYDNVYWLYCWKQDEQKNCR